MYRWHSDLTFATVGMNEFEAQTVCTSGSQSHRQEVVDFEAQTVYKRSFSYRTSNIISNQPESIASAFEVDNNAQLSS